jgi:hypothetical protein
MTVRPVTHSSVRNVEIAASSVPIQTVCAPPNVMRPDVQSRAIRRVPCLASHSPRIDRRSVHPRHSAFGADDPPLRGLDTGCGLVPRDGTRPPLARAAELEPRRSRTLSPTDGSLRPVGQLGLRSVRDWRGHRGPHAAGVRNRSCACRPSSSRPLDAARPHLTRPCSCRAPNASAAAGYLRALDRRRPQQGLAAEGQGVMRTQSE